MNGIDFYPFGNFNFIALAILAYGVLRYRLMDIRSLLHVTIVWAVISSLLLVPNIFLFYLIRPYFPVIPIKLLYIFITTWFMINFIYLKKIQPLIDQFFNKRKLVYRR